MSVKRSLPLLCAFWGALTAVAAPPNFVLILADDLGVNDLACYGRREHHTPNLDRLAAQGMRFTQAYCAQPICSPSRAAIITGQAPARSHLTTYLPGRPDCASQKLLPPPMRQALPAAHPTVATRLKAAGYATACVGKWHLGGTGSLPTDFGFDFYFPGQANTRPTPSEGGKGEFALTAAAESFIETNRSHPFFLYLAHNSPHIPYTARSESIARNTNTFEPTYAALLETLDESVGRLVAKIDALGLGTNTLIVFTSDNGGLHVPELKHERITHNTPFRAGKGFLYEGGLRIPLLVRWPGQVPAGAVERTPVIGTDWMPTLLALAAEPIPADLDGASLADLLRGSAKSVDRRLFWHFPHYTNQGGKPAGAIRDGDWKLVEQYEDGSLELYNLANDLGETTNLAMREPQRARKLQRQLADWRRRVGAQTNAVNPNFTAKLHQAIYIEFDASRFDPATATSQQWKLAFAWRRQMDEVATQGKP
jgi:arylsulfatase A